MSAIIDGFDFGDGIIRKYNYNSLANTPIYVTTNYGVTTYSNDCTATFQELIDTVHDAGGGIIYFPAGTYKFLTASASNVYNANYYNIELKSNVSIVGESSSATIFNYSGSTNEGSTLFGSFGGDSSPLSGCAFRDFTIDMSGQTVNSYSHKGKAFFVHGIKNCVFRDLQLLSCPSTALGIDMLDNVVMDSIYVYQGGREWTSGGNGGAGIGIGTGLWANENYIIRNCVCVECGHFGIFLEDQGLFSSDRTQNFPMGQIIANNIIRNGKHYGIGVRGGRYVNVSGNNCYSNTNGGIYLDYGADAVLVTGNLVADSPSGVTFGAESPSYYCSRCAIINNLFVGCTTEVTQTRMPTDTVIQNNVSI